VPRRPGRSPAAVVLVARGTYPQRVLTPRALADELRVLHVFSGLDDEQLAFLAARCRVVALAPGEVLFREGDPADVMFGVLEGEFRAKREGGTPDGRLFVRRTGQIGGVLPFSRITHFPVTGRAVEASRLACFASSSFAEMLERIPQLESRLAGAMADRVRETAQYDQQREMLIGLGKLAAGLAHELNNPVAAIVRTAAALGQSLHDLSDIGWALLERAHGGEAFRALVELRDRDVPAASLSAAARSRAEEELEAWLEERGLPEPWTAADTFLAAGMTADTLRDAVRDVPSDLLLQALGALEADLASRQRVRELMEGSRRVSDLVGAVKVYSHMDRAVTESEVDLHEGIRSTLTMLGHELRSKGVEVVDELAPEPLCLPGNPGELNQVWTNLIDNAIDAVAPGGRIILRTSASDVEVVVQVVDDGPGIPDEIVWRIFEPFFTTKAVGAGTGLGLGVVHRIVQGHHGHVRVESEPGRTLFEVRLPTAPPASR
jgi:signal transduction histidine kinase